MGLPSYVINFDELSNYIELMLEGTVSKRPHIYDGLSKSKSFYVEVPAIVNRYKILNWSSERKCMISSISFSQTGWKPQDNWSLFVNEEVIIDKSYTKEQTDKKNLEKLLEIKKDDTISIVLENNSGNYRGIWIELEYIKLD